MTDPNPVEDEPPVKEGFHRVYVETVGEVNTVTNDEVDLCKGCNTMKHLNKDGLCGRCVVTNDELRTFDNFIEAFIADEKLWPVAKLTLSGLVTADRAKAVLDGQINQLKSLRRFFERHAEYADNKKVAMAEYDDLVTELQNKRKAME